MTEQDVNNTLHSFDVIKQYQASGQSFEDFFEENKDLVKNEYSHEFKFIYYSHSTHRVWITDDCFLEHKRTMDFNGYTEESDEVYIKRLGVDDRYECCTIKDDDEYIAGRLTQSVSSDDIIDYLKHYGVKAAEFPFVYSSFSDNIGKENLKNAYLDTCSWEVKKDTVNSRIFLILHQSISSVRLDLQCSKKNLPAANRSGLTVLIRLFWSLRKKISLRTKF